MVSKNVPFLKSVVLTLVSLVCFAGVSVSTFAVSVYNEFYNGTFYIDGTQVNAQADVTLSDGIHKISLTTYSWNNNSFWFRGTSNVSPYNSESYTGRIVFADSHTKGTLSSNSGDAPSVDLYVLVSGTTIQYSANPIKSGPSFSSSTILSSAYCGGSATIDIDYEIDNATGSEVIKLYKGTTFESNMTTKSIDVTAEGEYHFELWYDGKCVDKSETVKVEAKDPTLEAVASKTAITKQYGDGTTPEITVTPNLQTCDSDKTINVSLSDNTNYVYDAGTKQLTFIGTEPGTYPLTMTFTHGSLTKTITITSQVVEYPKTYTIKKSTDGGTTWSDYELKTDNDGNINWTLSSGEEAIYKNEGTISCNNFFITTSSGDYSNCSFINKGTIVASGNINIGSSTQKAGGDGQSRGVVFDCAGIWQATNFTTNYRNATPDLKGSFVIENNFYVDIAQGQDLKITECTELFANNANINVTGGEMKLYIDGHVVAETFIMNNNVIVQKGAIMTIGEEQIAKSFIAETGSILNLCYNPTTGADKIGTCNECTVFYNYGEGGWENGSDPIAEGDVTGKVGDKGLQQVYTSYEDCIEEKNLSTLLGYDDDPFLPKDKELRYLYDINPCSEEFEDTKIQIREAGNKWFRYINGELIYCENDNQ